MNFYEFNLLITADLGEEKVKTFSEDLVSQFKEFGDIFGEIDFKRRRLAYSVQGENEAWLTVFFLTPKGDSKKEVLANIEKILKDKKEVLRYLILSKKEIHEKVKRTRKDAPEEENLEKVDQKVEELLKEEA
ncbi:MAG: 30S ribosomal protein S6 [Candidatus Pacebacteria bacterium]|nr:30S ribosomal protein S6 [Candidatus Paceibacterota bacterium]